MKKTILYILTIIIITILIGGGFYWMQKENSTQMEKMSKQITELEDKYQKDIKDITDLKNQIETDAKKKEEENSMKDWSVDDEVLKTYENDNVKFDLPENWGISKFGMKMSNKDITFTTKPVSYPPVMGPTSSAFTFIDNSDNHVNSFGKIVDTEDLKIGKYIVKKKIIDTKAFEGTYFEPMEGNFPNECSIQYHIIENKYVLCDNENGKVKETIEAIEYIISTFTIK
jgi:hypothetical protein